MPKPQKLYYSIREVAQMFDLNESTLRYWETEFPHLRPKTNNQGVRQYTDKDIEQVRVIHNLVKVRGFKLAAASRMLHANRQGAERTAEVLQTLSSIRDQLISLKRHLEEVV